MVVGVNPIGAAGDWRSLLSAEENIRQNRGGAERAQTSKKFSPG